MKRFGIIAAASLVVGLAALEGCGDGNGTGGAGGSSTNTSTSTSTSTATGTGGTGGGGGPQFPKAPTLGAQIDRMGRPAINTALNHTFDPDAAGKGTAKDNWNKEADPTKWATSFGGEVAKNLAILDSLDANCGNQLLADKTKMDPTRYSTLAGALVNDAIWIKADANSCGAYLAVEANATGLLANMECGGRKLEFDVIETSYSALAAGAISGVDDTIKVHMDISTTFPFMGGPH